tara:strand:- start:15403 stop:15615 length:213 start_codon:yes stop_codon:yes gene_type:complete
MTRGMSPRVDTSLTHQCNQSQHGAEPIAHQNAALDGRPLGSLAKAKRGMGARKAIHQKEIGGNASIIQKA